MGGGEYDYLYGSLNELADRIQLHLEKAGLTPETRELRVRFIERLRLMSDAARSIEWVDSGDYGPDREVEDIKKALAIPEHRGCPTCGN